LQVSNQSLTINMVGGGQRQMVVKPQSSRLNPHKATSSSKTTQRSLSSKTGKTIQDPSKLSARALSINRTPKSEISQPGKIFVLNSTQPQRTQPKIMGKKALKFTTSAKKKHRNEEGEDPKEFGNLLRRNIDFKAVEGREQGKFNGISQGMKVGNTPKQNLDGMGAK